MLGVGKSDGLHIYIERNTLTMLCWGTVKQYFITSVFGAKLESGHNWTGLTSGLEYLSIIY